MNKEDAILLARELIRTTRLSHVVRVRDEREGKVYFVCKQYVDGLEGYTHDAGYSAQGLLVWVNGREA
jgi:hypothetical protein